MRRQLKIALVAVLLAALPGAGRAQDAAAPRAGEPVEFRADTVTHSRDGDVVTATGNVEIVQAGRVLRARKVVYDRIADRMTASGDVVIMEPSGDAFFADSLEVSGDLKDGAAKGIRIRLRDNVRLSGASGRRIGGTRTELDDAVYTACPPCEDDPDAAPAWRIKAGKAVRDTEDETLIYRDAVFELWGVPVFYTPYFEYPDIDVRRKSGLLVPTLGVDGELGLIAEIPVFVAIAPDKDATLTPIFTENEGIVGLAEYRQRFPGGALRAEGSITSGSKEPENHATRGHLDADLAYDIDPTWRAGAALSLASDDTYLGRYGFSDRRTLTSNLFAEGFWGRNYAAANVYRFQGLRPTDDPDTMPLVAPEVDINFLSGRDALGGRTSIDANLRSLVRRVGDDSVRVSLNTGWQLPYISPAGQRIDLFARLQTDAYWVDPGGDGQPEVLGRVFPQAGVGWRYPFVRTGSSFSQIVGPVLGVVVAPRVGERAGIPNEDSLDLELDDTNVFDRSRATGLDLVEDGTRLYYGLRGSLLRDRGLGAEGFLGQTYRFGGTDLFPSGVGLDNDLSDIVGRFNLRIGDYVRLLYRFRFDHHEFMSRREEIGAHLGPESFRITANYLFIDNLAEPAEFAERRELNIGLATRLTESIALRGETRRDIANGRSLWHEGEIGYRGDCYTVSLQVRRSLTRDRDIRPTDSFFLRVGLKSP